MNEIHLIDFCAEIYKQRIDHNFLLSDFEKVCKKTKVDCIKNNFKQIYKDIYTKNQYNAFSPNEYM